MEKRTVLLSILNIIFCAAEIEFNYTSVGTIENMITVKHLNFTQWLDHKNPEDDRKFIQRYAVAATYYKKFGPAFLYLNGEGTLQREHEFPNNVLTYAQNLHAICFSLEHRFYGGSWPENGSIKHHLSSEQALLDIKYFITRVTEEFHLPKETKWIVFGCSYAGALAAWSKLMHPQIIHGAIASSSPVIAKVDYFEYQQIVEESLKSYHPNCVESITLAFEEIAHLVDSIEIRKNISYMFYLHEYASRTIARIKRKILQVMLQIIGRIVQYNDSSSITISLLCKIMMEYSGTKLEALAEIKKMHTEHRNDVKIPFKESQNFNSTEDEDVMPLLKMLATYLKKKRKAWSYQRCSEFGGFSSYTNVTFLSGVKHLLIPIEKDIENHCKSSLGSNFNAENVTQKIDQTNSQYGGLHFNVSNTIFIHGSLDPLYKLGLYKETNDSLYDTIFIKGTSHCGDVHRPKDTDVPELINARIKVFKILNTWLNNISTSNISKN